MNCNISRLALNYILLLKAFIQIIPMLHFLLLCAFTYKYVITNYMTILIVVLTLEQMLDQYKLMNLLKFNVYIYVHLTVFDEVQWVAVFTTKGQ